MLKFKTKKLTATQIEQIKKFKGIIIFKGKDNYIEVTMPYKAKLKLIKG